MNNFKIEIEVNLGQATLEALSKLISTAVQAPKTPAAEPEHKTRKAETKAAPVPEPAPVPVADDDDLPLSDAEKAAQEAKAAPAPSEADMRAAIQATRKRGVPAKTIREYIKSTFGVETSVECPENRRQELIDGLAKLAA